MARQDQQLLLDEQGFCDHGMGPAGTGRQQMEKRGGQVTHAGS
jgi:hypothetical protein